LQKRFVDLLGAVSINAVKVFHPEKVKFMTSSYIVLYAASKCSKLHSITSLFIPI